MPYMLSNNKLHVYLFSAIISILVILSQSACHIYRMDIKQGTEIEQSKLDQLKPRMTKQQVQKILGTTTLEPTSSNRLDYYYSINPNQDGITKQQHLILFFDNNNQLNHYAGDFIIDGLTTTVKKK